MGQHGAYLHKILDLTNETKDSELESDSGVHYLLNFDSPDFELVWDSTSWRS